MIKVKTVSEMFEILPNLESNKTYWLDESSIALSDDNIFKPLLVATADVYVTKNKEGRVGKIPISFFEMVE